MNQTFDYDLVIVGAGMVGSTLACALNGSGLSVAVVEAAPPTEFSPDQPYDLRVSALSVASQRIFDRLAVWPGIKSRRCCPYRRMRVWETAQQGDTTFDSRDIGEPVLGHIVENRVVQLALWDAMQGCDDITLICPAHIERIDYRCAIERAPSTFIHLSDGTILRSRLLVGADGGNSLVRRSVGIGVRSLDYPQQALVLSVETDSAQQDITWQKFVPTGPMAFLPLKGNQASLVWYHRPADVQRLTSMADDELLTQLQDSFPKELGAIKKIAGRASFPLKRQHALSYVKPGVALIGDAAHMIHPLAGQGVNIGLLDAATLAEVLIDAYNAGNDIADAAVLQQYEQRRRKHNQITMAAMDLFYRVFGSEFPLMKGLRNLGLKLAQRITPAKQNAMRLAMGLDGPLPRLATLETQD